MKGHEIREMHYKEYKENWGRCITVEDSYNQETKTIKVRIPMIHVFKITEDRGKGIRAYTQEFAGHVYSREEAREMLAAKADRLEKRGFKMTFTEIGTELVNSPPPFFDKRVV